MSAVTHWRNNLQYAVYFFFFCVSDPDEALRMHTFHWNIVCWMQPVFVYKSEMQQELQEL